MTSRRKFILGGAAVLASSDFLHSTATAAAPIVRRDVMDMAANDRFFSDYATAVKAMHSSTNGLSWMSQAHIHADHCHHGEVQILHWHRLYIRFFERICAKLSGNPQFALPYWNWSKNSGRIPAPFFDRPELNVLHWNDPGQYKGAAWGPIDTVAQRAFDKTHGLLDNQQAGGTFTTTAINQIKQYSTIDLFQPALEGGPHNTAHILVGAVQPKPGHMASGLSPLDPIFWLHHCMVDRVWAEWQKTGHITPDPNADYSGQFFDENGASANVKSTDALDISKLGYTYDIFVPVAPNISTIFPSLNSQQSATLSQTLRAGQTQTIGASLSAVSLRSNIVTAVDVGVPNLPSHTSALRAMAATGVTVGSRRILARLNNVSRPLRNNLVVNVFVNCPYLSLATPFTDPHYGGSFSFFGAAMPAMDRLQQTTYIVDITQPVRDLGLDQNQIKVQLLPITLAGSEPSATPFQVGSIDIIST